jgi:SET domain-containing protein
MDYVRVKCSKIHGNGVFAKVNIPKGTRIIEYVGEKITKAESEKRAEKILNRAKSKGTGAVYIFELNQRYDIDGNVSWNPARYINHACKTNCESDIVRGHIWIVATKNIKKGEELHYDYGYNLDNWQEHPCLCGYQNCAGYIVEKSLRARLKRKIAAQHKTVSKS